MRPSLQVRVTGILVENSEILLVRQSVSPSREWSLPGGRLEPGETLHEALCREMLEETGLHVSVGPLLYLCEKPDVAPPLIHITFRISRVAGSLRMPSNEHDANPIHDLRMAPIDDLTSYGFSPLFMSLAQAGFPKAGSYQGKKSNIGLDKIAAEVAESPPNQPNQNYLPAF